MSSRRYAELVINIEAALVGTFHYYIPADLQPALAIGHLVEVEFGTRLAQGIIVAFSDDSPVEETKPIIALIDPEPVVWPWQIKLARWMSERYLAPLNACLRLMLPPGLTRWADTTLDINPYWDGSGRLTETQSRLIDLLRARGFLRGKEIKRALPGLEWQQAAGQLTQRGILRRASVLDPPRVRPKEIRTVELIAGWERIRRMALALGLPNKQAAILHYLAESRDPLPDEATVLEATGATTEHLARLAEAGLINRLPGETIILPAPGVETPPEWAPMLRLLPAVPAVLPDQSALTEMEALGLIRRESQPAGLSLAIPAADVLPHIFRLQRAEPYYRALSFLAQAAQPVSLAVLNAETGATMKHLRRLAQLDLARFGAEEVWRDPLADRDYAPADPPALTTDQTRAWGRIKVAMILAGPEEAEEVEPEGQADDPEDADYRETAGAPPPFLIHGVTGSGKTEIYMRAIDFALARGQRAIVLVPEIALTPQTVRRFAARFPGRVAVWHSRLSEGERFDTWRRARRGLFDIVIGPRSALFAPLPDVGVIVLDEEHDPSYKHTPPVPPPYYHARDVAIQLGRMIGAVTILGSATPDVVSYHQARAGRYQLLELPRRIMGHRRRVESQAARLNLTSRYRPVEAGDVAAESDPDEALTIPLPPIQVVDLRHELRAGNRSIFSRALEQAVTETLERGEQCILFLNRRGTATFVNCRDCGHAITCPRCDLPMTYHQPRLQLICHQCGRREAQPQVCPQCGSDRIRYFGLGTEKVEEAVQQRWPQARITRWDRDTTTGRDSHESLLAGFINHEADILIGTQMIAKGLDLPFVTLVGVISADVALSLPDYHAGERTFQLLAQVAGRAGRGLLGGRVIIQTYRPDHYAIQAAAEHDYAAFYVEEIRFRTRYGLPPFRRVARLVLADPVNDKAQEAAESLAEELRWRAREEALAATEILGPVPPFFSRIDGRYRWQITIRTPDPIRLLAGFPIPQPWVIDIDPVSLL